MTAEDGTMTQLADAPVTKAASKMKIDPEQAHLENHAAFTADAGGPAWLAELRESAIRTFARNGLPHPKAEAWRWTKHRPVTTGIFTLAEPDEAAAGPLVKEYGFAAEAAGQAVIVDGRFSRELSALEGLPEGVDVLDLIEAAEVDRGEVQRHLGRHADVEKNPFVALNTAFIGGGVFVRVAEGVKLEKPIHLLFVSTGQSRAATRPRSDERHELSTPADRPSMA